MGTFNLKKQINKSASVKWRPFWLVAALIMMLTHVMILPQVVVAQGADQLERICQAEPEDPRCTGTQETCEARGYTWDASARTCRAPVASNQEPTLEDRIKRTLYRNALAICFLHAPLSGGGPALNRIQTDSGSDVGLQWFTTAGTVSLDVVAGSFLNTAGSSSIGPSGAAQCGNSVFIKEAFTILGKGSSLSGTDNIYRFMCQLGFRREDKPQANTSLTDCVNGSGQWRVGEGTGDDRLTLRDKMLALTDIPAVTLNDAALYLLYRETAVGACKAGSGEQISVNVDDKVGAKIKSLDSEGEEQELFYRWAGSGRHTFSSSIGIGEGISAGITSRNSGQDATSWASGIISGPVTKEVRNGYIIYNPTIINIEGGPRLNTITLGKPVLFGANGIGTDSPCTAMANLANNYFDAYKAYIALNPQENKAPGELEGGGSSTSPSTCAVEGLGWIVCPIMNALGGLSDAMFSWISSVLTLNPLQQTNEDGTTSPQYETWQVVRNLANVILVIAFLIIIFSQLTSMGISNYGVKKMLPRLIMIALAINLSFVLMQLLVDLTNIVGIGVKTILDSTAVLNVIDDLSYERVVEQLVLGSTAAIIGVAAVGAAAFFADVGASTLVLLALPFIVTAALSLFAAIATLFLRNALVIVLAIISPLAFAAYLLPNTQELFNKWRKLFTSMLMLYPMAALLFGGANFAAYVVVSSNQPFSTVIALFLIAAPLGALPFLIRSSNSILSGVGNKLQGFAKAAKNPLQRGLQSRVDNNKARYRSGERNWLGGTRRNPDEPGRRRTLSQLGSARKMNMENETAALKEAGDRRYKEAALDENRTDKTSTTARRNLDRLETEKKGSSSASEVFGSRQQRRAATAGTADARYADRSFDASEANRVAGAQVEERSKGRVQSNALSAVSGLGLGDQSEIGRTATERAKATQGRIDNKESESTGVRAAVQDQKSNDLTAERIKSQDQETFMEAAAQDRDAIQTILQTEEAKLGTAVAEGELDIRKEKAKGVGGTMLQEEMKRRALDEKKKSIVQRTDQMQAELATDKTDGNNPNARYLNLAGKETREMLQQAQQSMQVSRDATASAEGVARQEYATELQNDPAIAKRAGGVDPYGQQRVVAQATQVVDEARTKAVQAETVLLRDSRADPGALVTNLRTLQNPQGNGPATPEQLMAMVQHVGQTGTVTQITEIADVLSRPEFSADPAVNPDKSPESLDRAARVQQAFGQSLKANARVKSIGGGMIAELERGNQIGPFDVVVETRTRGGKYDPKSIAAMDVDELKRMTDFFNTPKGKSVPQADRDNVKQAISERIRDPLLQDSLNEEMRRHLTDLDASLT